VTAAPEKIGAIFEARVKDLASDGRGIVQHPSGRTYFVTGLWFGELARLRITQIKGKIGSAEVQEVLQAVAQRIDAPCPHHGVGSGLCGGCPWQFVEYSAQLEAKQVRVESSFRRAGVDVPVKTILPSANTLSYRNRAQLKSDGRQVGFVSSHSNALAPIDDCLILSDANRNTLAMLREQLPNNTWRPAKNRDWVTLDIDESTPADVVSVNKRLPFQQANSAQNALMRQWLSDKLQLCASDSTVLELFCGTGNLTEVISARGFEQVIAAEASVEAIDGLKRKELPNVRGMVANLFMDAGFEKAVYQAREAQVLVLDPPRDGLKVIEPLFRKKSRIKDVFYISCDLATLVRDVKIFTDNKYKVKEIQPLDMFPHTPHVECMVALKKK